MLGGLAAADAGGTEVFLLQRHAAAGDADLVLHAQLASEVAAPHGFIEAVGAVRDLVHFVHIVGDVGIGFAVGEGFLIEAVVDLLQQAGDLGFEVLQLDEGLFTVIPANQHTLAGFDILGADLQTQRDALHFVLGELPAGAVFGKVDIGAEGFFKAVAEGGGGFGNALLMLGDGHHHDLHGGDGGRQHQTVIIAVGHDDGADDAGGHAPAGLVGVLQGIAAVGELDIEGAGEAVPEVVGGTALQTLAIVHHGLDGIGLLGTREFFLIGLDALDDGDGQVFFTHFGIDIQHPHRFCLGFLGGLVHGVALLPQEFGAAQEGAGGFFPAHDAAPLVIQLGQVAVAVDDVGIVLAEQRFAGGAHAQALLQLFLAAHGDPCHLGGEALYVVLFLLQQAFRDEHGHIDVLVAGGLEHPVEDMLDILPDGIAVGADDHAAADAAVIDQLGLFNDVGIPLCEIVLHRGDFGYHFLLICHNFCSPFR